MNTRLQVSDLVQIVPAAARLEALGGDAAHRIRTGIVDLLVECCDVATLSGARFRLLQRVGEKQDLRDAELRLIDEALDRANRQPTRHPSVFVDEQRMHIPPAVGA
jgi:hypothetical protein